MLGERRGCWWLSLMALVALIAGAVGGSIGGGTVAYFLSKAPATTAPVKEPISDRSQQVIQADDSALVEVVNRIGPAVVTVISKLPGRVDLFGEVSEETAAGSGVIVDKKGLHRNQPTCGGGESRSICDLIQRGEEIGQPGGYGLPFHRPGGDKDRGRGSHCF